MVETTQVVIRNQEHRDDKPFVHRANGLYYLSWGCFYAVSNSSVYGPYDYVGSFAGQGSKRERNSQLQRLRSRPFSTRFG